MHFIQSKGHPLCLLLLLPIAFVGCVDDAPSRSVSSEDAEVTPNLLDGGGQIDGSMLDCAESGIERCDGEDNDCDGNTDEGFPVGESCTKETGLCTSDGVWACGEDGSSTVCDAPTPETADEICDEIDNDCDGETDETFDLNADIQNCGACGATCELPNASTRCMSGRCQIRTCNRGFVNTNEDSTDGCECEVQNAGDELCNGVDDDCDGQIDEGLSLGAACADGVGQCAVTGEVVCAMDGSTECSATPSAPVDELCNGYDDDCDGRIDETFDADMDGAIRCEGITCDGMNEGCPEGVDCGVVCQNYDCNDGDPQVNPLSPEICGDGVDQNCDGEDAECAVQAGRIVTLSVLPAGSDACRDLDGDGEIDNAFGRLAGVINPQIDQALRDGQLNLYALVYGLQSAEVVRRFDFAVVTGVRGRVHGSSLDEDGRPINMFPGAQVDNGAMMAGPRPFSLSLPIGNGVNLDLPTQNTLLSGDLTVPAQQAAIEGCSIENGLLTGALRQVDLEAAVNATAPQLVPLLGAFQPDLDNDRDGVAESLSVCLDFAVLPAELENIPPPLEAAP